MRKVATVVYWNSGMLFRNRAIPYNMPQDRNRRGKAETRSRHLNFYCFRSLKEDERHPYIDIREKESLHECRSF